ncbi:hypothetical protein ACW9HF_15040 [Nocardia gipuzkoensis]
MSDNTTPDQPITVDENALLEAHLMFLESPGTTSAQRMRDAVTAYLYTVAGIRQEGSWQVYPSHAECAKPSPACGRRTTVAEQIAIVHLPWTAPPLSMNDVGITRNAKFARARRIADARQTARILARQAQLPRGVTHVTVQLHYRPRNNIRRDTDNLVATLKPLCDGLAGGTAKDPGYGMVPDDIPAYMAKPEPIIHPAERGKAGALWLEITWRDSR